MPGPRLPMNAQQEQELEIEEALQEGVKVKWLSTIASAAAPRRSAELGPWMVPWRSCMAGA